MSIFAIRDDDTSFFTSTEDLDGVYGPYWGVVPVSLAVVPFAVPAHRRKVFSTAHALETEAPLENNEILVEWLREKVANSQVEVMLHGYSHRFGGAVGKPRGEFAWKPEAQLVSETLAGREYLETLLTAEIKVFVPPGNSISRAGVRAIRKCGLNLSGTMGVFGDRPFSLDYPLAYSKRWGWRVARGGAYPFPLRYGGHSELRAYALTPRANEANLLKSLEDCARWGAPFVLATHYWEFDVSSSMRNTLAKLIERADQLNMRFAPVSHCFEG